MRQISNVDIEKIKDDIYLFLNKYNHKWLNVYFQTKEELVDFLLDEDVKSLIYINNDNIICSMGILDENIIVTACFDDDSKTNENYKLLFDTIEKYVKNEGYDEIYFGESDYSFGLYEPDNEELCNYLESTGYKTESVSYDIKYSVKSLGKLIHSNLYDIKKFNLNELKNIYDNNNEYKNVLSGILAYFIRYPDDDCFLALSPNEDISGYALLDNKSNMLDRISIGERDAQLRVECERELLVSLAKYLENKEKEFLVREYVDQSKSHSISTEFEVCGKYKNISRGIK